MMGVLTSGRGMRLKGSEAIILDCSGVLVTSEVIHMAFGLERLEHLGFAYRRESYLSRSVGLSNAGFRAEVG